MRKKWVAVEWSEFSKPAHLCLCVLNFGRNEMVASCFEAGANHLKELRCLGGSEVCVGIEE
eukprot:2351944-Rhodomonas_salina.1